MRTTSKKEEHKVVEVESNLEDLCTLWEHETDAGLVYLSGVLAEKLNYQKVIAFYNITKRNEKEPDIRIYSLDDENKKDTNIISLWSQTSKENKKYYNGKTNDDEQVVGFINNVEEVKQPKIRIYLKK